MASPIPCSAAAVAAPALRLWEDTLVFSPPVLFTASLSSLLSLSLVRGTPLFHLKSFVSAFASLLHEVQDCSDWAQAAPGPADKHTLSFPQLVCLRFPQVDLEPLRVLPAVHTDVRPGDCPALVSPVCHYQLASSGKTKIAYDYGHPQQLLAWVVSLTPVLLCLSQFLRCQGLPLPPPSSLCLSPSGSLLDLGQSGHVGHLWITQASPDLFIPDAR